MRIGPFGGTLSDASPVALFEQVAQIVGEDVDLTPYRVEVERRIGEALAQARKERRALTATGLGEWYLPASYGDLGDGWSLWDTHYSPSGTPQAARERLNGLPGAPVTIKTQVEPSPDYPGMIRVTATILSSTKPPRVIAKAAFTSLTEGQNGPVGFVPHGIRVVADQDADAKPRVLQWGLDDRVNGSDPTLLRYGRLHRNETVTPLDDTTEYARKMAVTMATNNALACAKGYTPACGSVNVLLGAWPPVPKGNRKAYDRAEWGSAVGQIRTLPAVEEALTSGRLSRDRLQEWIGILRDQWDYTRGKGRNPGEWGPDYLRALMTERGADTGYLRAPGGDDNAELMTFPALLAEADRKSRLAVELETITDPAEAIALFRRLSAEYPTKGWLSYEHLIAPLKRMGWTWGNDRDQRGDLYDLTQGNVTWAAFAAKREAAHQKYEAEREAKEAHRRSANVAALYRLAAFLPRITPGFYTHTPTRERLLNVLGLDVSVLFDRYNVNPRVRLAGKRGDDAFLITDVQVSAGPSDPTAEILHKYLDVVRRFGRGAVAGETAEQAMLRWEGLAIPIGHTPPTVKGRPFQAENVGDLRTYLEDHAQQVTAWLAEKGITKDDPAGDFGAANWGLETQTQDTLKRMEDSGNVPQDPAMASTLLRWISQSAKQAREMGVPVGQHAAAFTVVWDFVRRRPPGTTHPDGPFAMAILRRASEQTANRWAERQGIYAGIPKPFPAEWLLPGSGSAGARGADVEEQAEPAPFIPEPEPIVPVPVPVPVPVQRRAERAERAERPERAEPVTQTPPEDTGDFRVRGSRAARAARTSSDVWPPSAKPVVQTLIATAPTPADLTREIATDLLASLDPKAAGSLRVYLREAVALGRIPAEVLP